MEKSTVFPTRALGADAKPDIDPITLSVLLSRFQDISEEMMLTLERSARTPIMSLARDFSCAIYDGKGRQIAMGNALPGHTSSLHLVLAAIIDAFQNDVHDGDAFLCNSPFHRNTHVGDLVAAEPVYIGDEVAFWSVCKGHQLDVGAFLSSSVEPLARDVFQEGLHIPPIRLIERGSMRQDVLSLYLANVRYPDLLHGDLMAELGSTRKGAERLLQLVYEYGYETLHRYLDAILDYGSRRMLAMIERIPNGRYEGTVWIDSDAVERRNIPVVVTVTVSDDHVHCDFSGSAPQSRSGINGSFATLNAAPAIPFMYYLEPDAPHNHGIFEHLSFGADEGSIVWAKYPASTSCGTIVPSDATHDAVNKALASAIPDLVPAGGSRGGNNPNFSGVDSETGEAWGMMFFNHGGGGGASKGADGWPLISTVNAQGSLKAAPIEQTEQIYPMRILRHEIEMDSMGCGRWMGGPGARLDMTPAGNHPVEVETHGDGEWNVPHGVLGGTPGRGGGQWVEAANGSRRFYGPASTFRVQLGEVRVGCSTGGGGYGSPLERDIQQVRRDVRDGFISRRTAADIYGVILDDHWDPHIDEIATESRRQELARQSRPLIDPDGPATSTWLENMIREGDTFEPFMIA